MPNHVDRGQGSRGTHVYLPEPAWAFALAHVSRRVDGVRDDDLELRVRPSLILATALQESRLGCGRVAADPEHGAQWIRRSDTLRRGCFQIARQTAWKEIGRLFPKEVDADTHTYDDAISSIFGRDNFVAGAHVFGLHAIFAYAMTFRSVPNPDLWFQAATEPRAREKVLSLAWNRGAWSREITTAMEGCPKGDIQRCLPPESVQRAHVVSVARWVEVLEAAVAAGSCYDEPVDRGAVASYVDAWARLRPRDDWTAVRDAAVNAFDLVAGDEPTVRFQHLAPRVMDAIDEALDRPLRCPDQELDAWYRFSCPP